MSNTNTEIEAVNVGVLAYSFDKPEFFFCRIACTDDQLDSGDHYEKAKEEATNYGYEYPMFPFDEFDPCGDLLPPRCWKHAPYFDIKEQN